MLYWYFQALCASVDLEESYRSQHWSSTVRVANILCLAVSTSCTPEILAKTTFPATDGSTSEKQCQRLLHIRCPLPAFNAEEGLLKPFSETSLRSHTVLSKDSSDTVFSGEVFSWEKINYLLDLRVNGLVTTVFRGKHPEQVTNSKPDCHEPSNLKLAHSPATLIELLPPSPVLWQNP